MLEAHHARNAPRAAMRRIGERATKGESSARQDDRWRRLCVASELLSEGQGEIHAVQQRS